MTEPKSLSKRSISFSRSIYHLRDEVESACDSLRILLNEARTEKDGKGGSLKQIFDKYDADSSGSLDMDEWREAMKDLGVSANDDVIDALFSRYDSDNSGSLDYTEFLSAASDEAEDSSSVDTGQEVERITLSLRKVIQQKRGVAALKKLFDKYDSDGSGTLEAEEFMKTLEHLGVAKGANEEDLRAVFERFDVDNSGSLEFMEFIKAVSNSTLESRVYEQEKLKEAREKHKQIEKHKEKRAKEENELKDNIADLEAKLAKARTEAQNANLEAANRMAWLQKAQTFAEQLEENRETYKKKTEDWDSFSVRLDDEDMRLLRGVLAMEGVKKKLQANTEFKKAAKKAEVTKVPTTAEVKAKAKQVELELKNIAEEEETWKARIKNNQKEKEILDKKLEEISDSALMQKMQLMTQLQDVTIKMEEDNVEFEEIQVLWKERKEACKFTPEEERILRGIKAIMKTRTEMATKAGPKEETALAALRRAKSRANLKTDSQKLRDQKATVAELEEKMKRIMEQIEGGEITGADMLKKVAEKEMVDTNLTEAKQDLTSLEYKIDMMEKSKARTASLASIAAERRKSVGFALSAFTKGKLNTDDASESESVGTPTNAAKRASASSNVDMNEVQATLKRLCARIEEEKKGAGNVESMFRHYDLDGNGSLGLEEWIPCMKELGISQSDDVLEALFNHYDADHSGSIDFEEFVANPTMMNQTEIDRVYSQLKNVMRENRGILAIKKIFEKYDVDGSGNLEVDEFSATLQDLGIAQGASSTEIQAVFKKLDIDNSGSIAFMEFVEHMKNDASSYHKEQAKVIRLAKEKEKAIACQKALKEKEIKDIAEKREQQEVICEQLKKQIDAAPLVEKIPLMERAVTEQELLAQYTMDEREIKDRWQHTPALALTEEEMRALRGLKAMMGLKRQVEDSSKFQRVASTKGLYNVKSPTTSQVKAKVAAKEKLQQELGQQEEEIKNLRKERQQEFDALNAKVKDAAVPTTDKMVLLGRLEELGVLLEETSDDLPNLQAEYREKMEPYQLSKDDERVLRGIKAREALRATQNKSSANDLKRLLKRASSVNVTIKEGEKELREKIQTLTNTIEQKQAAEQTDEIRQELTALNVELDRAKQSLSKVLKRRGTRPEEGLDSALAAYRSFRTLRTKSMVKFGSSGANNDSFRSAKDGEEDYAHTITKAASTFRIGMLRRKSSMRLRSASDATDEEEEFQQEIPTETSINFRTTIFGISPKHVVPHRSTIPSYSHVKGVVCTQQQHVRPKLTPFELVFASQGERLGGVSAVKVQPPKKPPTGRAAGGGGALRSAQHNMATGSGGPSTSPKHNNNNDNYYYNFSQPPKRRLYTLAAPVLQQQGRPDTVSAFLNSCKAFSSAFGYDIQPNRDDDTTDDTADETDTHSQRQQHRSQPQPENAAADPSPPAAGTVESSRSSSARSARGGGGEGLTPPSSARTRSKPAPLRLPSATTRTPPTVQINSPHGTTHKVPAAVSPELQNMYIQPMHHRSVTWTVPTTN